jgi:site-specific DNA recombinase
VTALRCAVYARFSNEKQSPLSIEDQIRKCREEADRRRWTVLLEHIYSDEAISGASTERDGLQRLLAAATSAARPVDCILIDDTSRLTRKLADALNLYEKLTFAGIRLVAVSQGVDSDNAQAELLIGVHGLIDAVYWRELAQKTHRGMQGRALAGFATGGRCFGYRSVKGPEETVRLEIEPSEAATVRRIFELYSAGQSLKRIAWQLNSEGVPSPQPQKGRVSRSWCTSSVRTILKNERYIGKMIWNKKRKVRVPGTGRRVYRPRPRSEWVTVEAPHLRIISEELWAGVERRFGIVGELWHREGSRPGLARGQQRQAYFFSGLLRCGVCGGSITLVCGRGKHGAQRYGCSMHHQRGNSVCSNSLLIRRDELEERLLRRLQESVLREEVIDYAVARLRDELQKRHEELNAGLRNLKEEKQRIEGELRNLVESIAVGNGSPAIMAAITERENRIRAITNLLVEPGPGSLQEKLEELRTLAVRHLTEMRCLLAKPENVHEARAVLAERVGTFTLSPVSDSGEWSYTARGSVDFFGQTTLRVDGAGGQNRTGYARLFRAALYQ